MLWIYGGRFVYQFPYLSMCGLPRRPARHDYEKPKGQAQLRPHSNMLSSHRVVASKNTKRYILNRRTKFLFWRFRHEFFVFRMHSGFYALFDSA